jgi:hypothetical protein
MVWYESGVIDIDEREEVTMAYLSPIPGQTLNLPIGL